MTGGGGPFLLQGAQPGIHLGGTMAGIKDRPGIGWALYIGSLQVDIKK